MLPQIIHFLRW